MALKSLLLSLAAAALCFTAAVGGDRPPLARNIQQQLTSKYLNHRIVNWCSGKFVGREKDAVAALLNPTKKQLLVLWVMAPDTIQELDTIEQTGVNSAFELQCLDAKQVRRRQDTLRNSETITNSLKVPNGAGALCYFTDNTTAKCWSLDRASGRLTEVGGWQT